MSQRPCNTKQYSINRCLSYAPVSLCIIDICLTLGGFTPRIYALDDVTSYNFTTKSPQYKAKTAATPTRHDVRKVNPAPSKIKVSDNLIQLEKEIRYQSRNLQDLFRERGAIYDDTAVIAYINAVARRLMEGSDVVIKDDVNFRLIREPTVNAFAFVDGSIYIHTGALARLENEAQLAFLLAHEISHSLNKDIIYNMENYHSKTVVFKVTDIVLSTSSVFFGILGDVAQAGSAVLYVTSILGYSRDIEARADKDAILWVTKGGYNPHEAAGLMRIFLNEKKKYSRGIEIFFLMSHPSNRYRLDALNKLVRDTFGEQTGHGDVKSEEFLHNMVKIKLYNAALNIKTDRLEHARDNIDWVLEKYPDNAEAHYLEGEVFRIGADTPRLYRYELNQEGWQRLNSRIKKEGLVEEWRKKAEESYSRGIRGNPSYADLYKGMGMLCASRKDKQAVEYLNKYLDLYPAAPDKRYVNSVIRKVQLCE